MELRPVYKLKFVSCGPVSQFSRAAPTKLKEILFQIVRLIINNFWQKKDPKNSQGKRLNAKGIIFWILTIYLLIPVKTEFAKRIKIVEFSGDK